MFKIVILLECYNIRILSFLCRFQLQVGKDVCILDLLFSSIVRTATIPALGAIIENVSFVDVSNQWKNAILWKILKIKQ